MMSSNSTNRLHFPAKIYLILENESPDIIRWHPNNKAFRIVDHQRFEREIIPKYFRHNQMSSVQRQLNLYGFRCVSRGEDKGSFYHPKFHRGDWEQAKLIRRCVSHTQFGLQHWKLPTDSKEFSDSHEKTFEFQETEIKEPEHEEVKMMPPHATTMPNQKRTDWTWPPTHVEQQRSLNNTILKAFNSSDVSKTIVPSNNQSNTNPVKAQPSSLANRLGFRWNVNTEGSDFLTNQAFLETDPLDVADFEPSSFALKAYPSDTFEELIEMCQDLDTFLEDCESATIW